MGRYEPGAKFCASNDQVAAFRRDGYLIVRGLFSEEETALVRDTMERYPIVRVRYVGPDGIDEFMAYVDDSDPGGQGGATVVIRPTRVVE